MGDDPLPTLHWPPRPDRIVALVDALRADVDAVDLNRIDGEFFWRICADELADPLWQLALMVLPAEWRARFEDSANAPAGPGADAPEDAAIAAHMPLLDAWLAALRRSPPADAAIAARVRRDRDPEEYEVDGHVWEAVLRGEPIPYRAPVVVDATDDRQIHAYIVARHWTGRDVEARLARLRSLLDAPKGTHPPASERLEFALVRRSWRIGRWAIPPYVRVSVSRPLPAEGVVGRAYDVVVRGLHGWHEALPGRESQQTKTVAILAWATSLLARNGMKMSDAQSLAEEHLGLEETVDGSRVRAAREDLIKRVPYAERFVKQSSKWPNPFENA